MADAESREPGFEIDGKVYPVPTFETFTMDEAQVLYDYSGLAVEDFAPAHPEASREEVEKHEAEIVNKAKNPGFKRALVHIAYARGNPDESYSRVKEIVGKANMVDMLLGLAGEDAGPPEMTDSQSEPESETVFSLPLKSSASGSPSTNGSDEPAETPAPTGTSESATSSPLSALTT